MFKWCTALIVATLLSGCSQADLDDALTFNRARAPAPSPAPQPQPAPVAESANLRLCQDMVAGDVARAKATGFDDATVQRMAANTARQCVLFTGR